MFDILDRETKIAKLVEGFVRTEKGEIPDFLRHIEVSAESSVPEDVISLLSLDHPLIERTLNALGTGKNAKVVVELSGACLQFSRTASDTVRIQVFSSLSQAA